MTKESCTKRFLPHWYRPGAAHFVTFRLADSLPREVLDGIRQQKELLLAKRAQKPYEPLSIAHKKLFALYDSYLDQAAHGNPLLSDPRIASIVRGSLYFLHRHEKLVLLAYTIMPNHVHALFIPRDVISDIADDQHEIGKTPDSLSPLASIMHSLKSFTAHEANRILQRHGPFWQRESYDHWVRDDDELDRIIA